MNLRVLVVLGGEWMPSEWELIEQAKSGDKNALNEIVAQSWRPLYRFISYKTGNLDEAQDIVQETFYRAFRSLASYQKTDTRFTTWLGRIASNLITDMWRKKGRLPATSNLSEYGNELVDGKTPSEILVDKETREMLTGLLKELPDEQRRVIELRIIAGVSIKDTSIAIDKSEAAIKMLQHRALKTLREKMLNRGAWK
jgi:RNA polymerase sigma-70 factor (ECF subfamily)